MNSEVLTAFHQLDIRVGTILEARTFEGARQPAIQLWIDFGPMGIKKSSAQITNFYSPETLVGQQVLALINLPPRQIANFMSECLVLGLQETKGSSVILIQPERPAPNGWKLA